MTPEERELLATRLTSSFVLHGMTEHVHLLQKYAAAGRKGEAGKPGIWSDAYALRWAAIFQIPPYENVLRVRPGKSSCDGCLETATHISGKYPGGWVVKCDGCSLEWLVLGGDEPPA